MIAAIAAIAVAPAAAQATVTTTNITSWTSDSSGTPPNSPYLISYDNQPTRLTVTGTAPGATTSDRVDIVCYAGANSQFKTLVSNLAVKSDGTFSTLTGTAAPPLSAIIFPNGGRPCRLRAVPHNGAGSGDTSVFAGPNLAISETALLPTISGGLNNGVPYNFFVNGVTFTASAAWKAPGTPATPTAGGCGGPYATTVDPAFDLGNEYPIDCAGSLFGDDLGTFGGRSEVVIDGRNAYDPAAAQGLIPRTGGQDNGSQDLPGFPKSPDKSFKVSVDFDPSSGRISSRLVESFVSCHGPDPYKPLTTAVCPSFDATGVALTRVISTSDGGQVMTLTDTWSSTDGKSHTLDLLYDDYAGVFGNADGERGWQFPGQSGFTQYAADASVPASGSAPASILLRTNISAPDGDPNEGFGAITFGHAPTAFRFADPSELEEHQLLSVPAGGTASLSYVYSIASSQANIDSLAVAALDRFQPAAVQITSPADGTTVSGATVTVAGTATAGSGIKAVVVDGQTVPVAGGTWSAQVPLNPGANSITAQATDGAGATTQAQLTIVYQPPGSSSTSSSTSSSPSTPTTIPTGPTTTPNTPASAKCHVPRVKGMRLRAAEQALRKAHCRVGKIKHVRSRKLARGRVMNTRPHAHRGLPAGSRIELFVSKGR